MFYFTQSRCQNSPSAELFQRQVIRYLKKRRFLSIVLVEVFQYSGLSCILASNHKKNIVSRVLESTNRFSFNVSSVIFQAKDCINRLAMKIFISYDQIT